MPESGAVHPGRSARGYLLALAHASGISRRRVDEVLGIAGLEGVAGRRAARHGIALHQLIIRRPSLKEAFMETAQEYRRLPNAPGDQGTGA
jgi:hypothetical protein